MEVKRRKFHFEQLCEIISKNMANRISHTSLLGDKKLSGHVCLSRLVQIKHTVTHKQTHTTTPSISLFDPLDGLFVCLVNGLVYLVYLGL